jgi:hypothetical protein
MLLGLQRRSMVRVLVFTIEVNNSVAGAIGNKRFLTTDRNCFVSLERVGNLTVVLKGGGKVDQGGSTKTNTNNRKKRDRCRFNKS